jgi:hypothetical protein
MDWAYDSLSDVYVSMSGEGHSIDCDWKEMRNSEEKGGKLYLPFTLTKEIFKERKYIRGCPENKPTYTPN